MTPSEPLRLLCVLAHPDDESLGMGGTLAHYAAQGVETHVLTATRGEAGRHGAEDAPRPEPDEVGRVRERELRAAAEVLGGSGVQVLGYPDGGVDEVDPEMALGRVVAEVRRVRPQVVLTFDPFGAYGHPDHIAVSQLAQAATVAAGDPTFQGGGADARAHRVSKLYYLAWTRALWEGYQRAFKELVSHVDGVARRVRPWPEWAVTTHIEAGDQWKRVWRAVRCHESQMALYGRLAELDEDDHRVLWGRQMFYRAYSLVNGGRDSESDLFDGLR